MVPRCETASSRLMPMPLSRMVSVFLSASASIQIASSVSPAISSGLLSASKRNLSLASEAFEISSRRKISRWLYSEWIMSFSSSRTSAWKPSVSLGVSFVLGVVMAPADCGRRNQNSSPWLEGPADQRGRTESRWPSRCSSRSTGWCRRGRRFRPRAAENVPSRPP